MDQTLSRGVAIADAAPEVRSAYLRRVLGITVFGLGLAAVVGIASTMFIATQPWLLSGYGPLILILGLWAITNFVARPMVFGTAKWPGFLLGTISQGAAMGFILLVGIVVSQQAFASPFRLVGTALGITLCTGIGLAIYVSAERREFSLLRAGLSATFIPMLILMAVSFAFPNFLGGPIGIAVGGVFVLVSAAGLLYQLNLVMHEFSEDMAIEGAYIVTIGLLILFWNVLSLLTRIFRR
ncbi:MAG: Bax inhibitor-1 family protein [Candidatus Eisenbacteria bacterium]